MTAADVTAIITAVDFDTIIVGIAGIAAALMLPSVAKKGARMLLSFVR